MCELRFEHARLVGSAGAFSHWMRTRQRLERVLSFGFDLGNLNRFSSALHLYTTTVEMATLRTIGAVSRSGPAEGTDTG